MTFFRILRLRLRCLRQSVNRPIANPNDSLTYGTVGVIMLASSLLATLIPARRALVINPTEALRYE